MYTNKIVASKFVHILGSALDVGHKKARTVYSVLKIQRGISESQSARLRRQDVVIPKYKLITVVCGKLNKSILKAVCNIETKLRQTMACWMTGKAAFSTVTQ